MRKSSNDGKWCDVVLIIVQPRTHHMVCANVRPMLEGTLLMEMLNTRKQSVDNLARKVG